MAEPMISLQGVTKVFPNSPRPAVGDLSFDVAEVEEQSGSDESFDENDAAAGHCGKPD